MKTIECIKQELRDETEENMRLSVLENVYN